MKINIMSDLHYEFGGIFQPPKSDVLILAGDIGLARRAASTIRVPVEIASEQADHIIMIMGNHEHYDHQYIDSYHTIKEELKDIENFTLLENEVKVIDDVAFIGSTFWSDLSDPLAAGIVQWKLNDYMYIKYLTRKLTPADTTKIHFESMAYVFEQIEIQKAKGLKTFVITHHNPTFRVAKQYRNDITSKAYATDHEDSIVQYEPNFWAYGHTHISAEYVVGKTQLICNPRGYVEYEVNPEFDPYKMVEL